MKINATTILAEAARDRKATEAAARRDSALLRSQRRAIARAIAPLVKAYKRGALRWDPSVWVSGGTVGCCVAMGGLTGFKDPRLVDLLAAYVDMGATTSTKDYPAALQREFEIRLPFEGKVEQAGSILISISAFVASDSPTCRKVLVKQESRTVIQETFEIVCD